MKEMTRTQELLGGYDPVAEGEQDENGIDLDLLRVNLKLSFEERVEKHRRAVESVLALMRAAEAAGCRRAS